MRILVHAFLVAYALDAGISLLDDALASWAGVTALRPLRNAVAVPVFLASAALYGVAALTPRLPKRIVLPPALFLLWWGFGAVPLGLFVPAAEHRALLAGLGQLLLAAGAFAWVRRRSGGSWLLPRETDATPAFRLRYTAGFLALHLILFVPLTAAFAVLSTAQSLVLSTGGFVAFGRDGMQVVERRYRAPGREVVLVGMVHIGEPALYRDLFASFAVPETVVLEEGVTGLHEALGVSFSYEPIASSAGLQVQPSFSKLREELEAERPPEAESWPHLRHADLDASAFSSHTLDMLARMGRLIHAESLRDEAARFAEYLRQADPGVWRRINHDMVGSRNHHVLVELDGALDDYERIVIPWGALHMPGIEHGLVRRNFDRSSERRHLAVGYGTLGRGMWRGLRALSR